jgi:hypothetical protein
METQIKSPVQIVQEFIALHTTRKEAAEKLHADAAAVQQSDGFIAELMEELSNYGDAVMASTDRENEYQQTWNNTLGKAEGMAPEQQAQTFQALEASLKNLYQTTLENETELPVPLREMLTKQAGRL